jgi:hypothetical protein
MSPNIVTLITQIYTLSKLESLHAKSTVLQDPV